MMNTLMLAVEKFDFLSTYTLCGREIIVVHDFLGFTEDWDEISNPNVDWDVVEDVCEIAERLGIEVEFTSEDI